MTGEYSTAERGDSTRSEGEIASESETVSESESVTENETANGDQTERESKAPEASETQSENTEEGVTRRTFIQATGATAAGAAGVAANDDAAAQETQTYRFGGEVPGWQAREPTEIEGETNPTIELEAGQEYEFWFENIDGAPHNMTMQDDGGNAIVQSELNSSEGATASVTFTATPQMTEYICTIHPTTMVGDVNVTGELEGGQGAISFRVALIASAIVLAFISPFLFALFLFSRGGDRGGEASAET